MLSCIRLLTTALLTNESLMPYELANGKMRHTNEELLAIIGSWAKEHVPVQYAETLKQVSKPAVFRAYLLRLIEIRADGNEKLGVPRDTAFIGTLPVSVLDETSLKRTAIIRSTGRSFVIAGDKYQGSRELSWTSLEFRPPEFQAITDAIAGLDLEWMP